MADKKLAGTLARRFSKSRIESLIAEVWLVSVLILFFVIRIIGSQTGERLLHKLR